MDLGMHGYVRVNIAVLSSSVEAEPERMRKYCLVLFKGIYFKPKRK